MVAKAKKPEPSLEVKAPTPQRPKPKVVREKPPEIKPERRVQERPKPTERPRPVAQQPRERPRPRQTRSVSRPQRVPRENRRTSAPPPNSSKRLTRGDRANQPARGPAAGVPTSPEESGGRTGYLPSQGSDASGTEFDDSPNDSGDGRDSGPGSEAGPGPGPGRGSNDSPPPSGGNDKKPEAKDESKDEQKDERKNDSKSKEPTRILSREASVSSPGVIKLPSSLRRDTVNLSLQVRVVIGPDGSADFKLGESSGNPEADDFILNELRKVAQVTTALDEQGQPKRAVKRVTVKIEIN